MKRTAVFVLSFCLVSCTVTTEEELTETDTATETQRLIAEPASQVPLQETKSLSGMHFLLGGGIHEDACAITEACDCCNADLMFLSDTEFIYDDLCKGHYIRKGTYHLKGNEVVLEFEPLLVSYYHNEESETAPTKPGSILRTEQKEKSVEVYTIGKCKDSVTITNNDTVEDVAFVAGILKDKEVARKKIRILKEIGAWELLAVK